MEIKLYPQDKVQKYSYQMDIVLGVLNQPSALVTDESDVGDFVDTGDPSADTARVAELADIFNMKVGLNTKLWELARSICWEELAEPTDED